MNTRQLDGWGVQLHPEVLAGGWCLMGLRRGFPFTFHWWCSPHQPTQPLSLVGPPAVLAQLFVQLCSQPDGRRDSGWKEKHVAFCTVFKLFFSFLARSVP